MTVSSKLLVPATICQSFIYFPQNSISGIEFGFTNATVYVTDQVGDIELRLPLAIFFGTTELNFTITITLGDNVTAQQGVGTYYCISFLMCNAQS